MATELPISNGYYVSDNLPLSHQRCSNVYPNIPEVPALSQGPLFFTAGQGLILTTGDARKVNRGSHLKGGLPYFVQGDSLYRLDRSTVRSEGAQTVVFSTELLGSIEGRGRVSMASNGTQLVILVPGGAGYVYNEDAEPAFQEITDSDFRANGDPQIVQFVDGYFLFSTDEKKIIVSNLNDGLTYDALDFAAAETDPDGIVAPIVVNNLVYVIGTETVEGFQNLPTIGSMPFIRNSIILDKGCKAPFSVVSTNSSFFMVGAGKNESPAVWQFINNGFRKKSTTAIEQLLGSLSDVEIENIFAMSFSEEGSYFVTFTLPNTTICFDLINERWHERNSFVNENETSWRVGSIVKAYGITIVADDIDGRIGQMSTEFKSEYGDNLIRLFSTQPFSNLGDEIIANMLELTMESGVGTTEVPDPVASLAASSDSKRFGPERVRKIGKKGEFDRRTVWYRNGRFDRFVVLQFRMSEPVASAFIKLEFE